MILSRESVSIFSILFFSYCVCNIRTTKASYMINHKIVCLGDLRWSRLASSSTHLFWSIKKNLEGETVSSRYSLTTAPHFGLDKRSFKSHCTIETTKPTQLRSRISMKLCQHVASNAMWKRLKFSFGNYSFIEVQYWTTFFLEDFALHITTS